SIAERIGRGGMGVVYRGRHTKLPREVAIKSINPRTEEHDLRRLRHRFEREAFIQSQLDHPGIVKIYDYIVAEQTYYIVMEYVEGRSLAQLLAQEARPLAVERALHLFDQILAAISYAHTFTYRDVDGAERRGIVHRDLKPPNILVTPQDQIKITDFGIVKLVGSEYTDTSGADYGTPQYASPEQAEGLPVDQRADLYSLGIILYEMLTGRPPFGCVEEPLHRTEILRAHIERAPRPPTELNPQVPPEIAAIVLRALEKDPAARFQTAADFLRALRRTRHTESGEHLLRDEPSYGSYHYVGTHELTEQQATDTARQSYVTQSIRHANCAACGAEAHEGAEQCRACGAELPRTSSATTRIVRQEAATERGWLFVVAGFIALTLIGLAFGTWRARQARRPQVETTQAQSPPTPGNVAPTNTPLPANVLEIKPARVSVDSSYDGYSTKPLTDGIEDVRRISALRYNAGNWASAETPAPHWIELTLAHPARLTAVYVYWGFDRDHFMPARNIELQAPDEHDNWQTIATLTPGDNYDRTAFEFAPRRLARLRLLQPAQQGPPGRPFVMWVREVKLFGTNEDR
ncbi:MAG TPA: protein kinase, partial [Pyrinomonadaceae bacterium]|nr:protein kinase [Pyrinomonadaceae bacterium]